MRRRSLQMIYEAGQGHPGGDLSATDVLAALYFGVLRYDPALPTAPDRDRFVMSKGHCTGALYTALAGAGFFPEAELSTYLQPNSRLNGHPNRTYLPGVETNTGPLGHGLPVAVGIAIAGQIDSAAYRTFVLTGDGELQEGSMWEAAMLAGHRKLGNLTAIIDRNRLQQGARTEDTNALEPWPTSGGRSAGTSGRRRRPRPRPAAGGPGRPARPRGATAVRDRRHDQGLWCLVHAGQGRLAPWRPQRRSNTPRPWPNWLAARIKHERRGSFRPRPAFDCRDAYARTLEALGRREPSRRRRGQ
ncbi:transketolase [Caulobacter segnis]